MSDQVILALIALVGATIQGYLSYLILRGQKQVTKVGEDTITVVKETKDIQVAIKNAVVETKEAAQSTAKHTNSMHEEIVKLTREKALVQGEIKGHAEGKIEGQKEGNREP